ncbi:MAG: Membrane lipoprotein TmpC [Fimbriimonadaceae bacterium]|nr:Membrane lipoprotein TmpC [Fimbriimonadaceae bacterium]
MKQKWMGIGLTVVLGLAGCNGQNATEGTGSTSTGNGTARSTGASGKILSVGVVFDSGGRGDKSFNDSCWAGVQRAIKDFGVKESTVETKAEKDYEANLTAMAEKGCDLVISVGINTKNALAKVAPMFPETKFALIDADVDAPNVRNLKFKEEEGSFMVGLIAGLMTKSGKVGFIGGMEIDLIKKFEAGYIAGVRTSNPKAEVLPAKYTGDWNNADYAKVAAVQLFGSGADIIFAAAGRAGLGMIKAAKEQGKYAIGVDSDQDGVEPGTVLTSMMKRVDEAVYQTIKDLQEGKFQSGTIIYDLKANGVGISDLTHTRNLIGEEKLKKVDDWKQKVIAGEIVVPADMDALKTFVAK